MCPETARGHPGKWEHWEQKGSQRRWNLSHRRLRILRSAVREDKLQACSVRLALLRHRNAGGTARLRPPPALHSRCPCDLHVLLRLPTGAFMVTLAPTAVHCFLLWPVVLDFPRRLSSTSLASQLPLWSHYQLKRHRPQPPATAPPAKHTL